MCEDNKADLKRMTHSQVEDEKVKHYIHSILWSGREQKQIQEESSCTFICSAHSMKITCSDRRSYFLSLGMYFYC